MTTIDSRQEVAGPADTFDHTTAIDFSLDRASHVTIRIYDARGAVVRELLNESRALGSHRISWDGRKSR